MSFATWQAPREVVSISRQCTAAGESFPRRVTLLMPAWQRGTGFRYNPGLVAEASGLHRLQGGAIAVLNAGFNDTGAINVFITTAAGDGWKPRLNTGAMGTNTDAMPMAGAGNTGCYSGSCSGTSQHS